MPIYEYRCRRCGRISEFLLLGVNDAPALVCRKCGGEDLERVLSRVRVRLSEETRMERLADPHRWGSLADVDENDPASVARAMRQFGPHLKEALGEDYPGEMDEIMEEAMAGGLEGEESEAAEDLE
jgi:putative FmdB family regulatory protein